MARRVVFCGYGWMAGYVEAKLTADNINNWHVAATTTTPDKAERLKAKGIDSYIFKLGDDTVNLVSLLSHSTLILNIPPGRRRADFEAYTHQMKSLVNDALEANVEQIVLLVPLRFMVIATATKLQKRVQPNLKPHRPSLM